MEGFIHEVTVFSDLTTVIALPEMISLVNQLLDVTTEDVPFIFVYDTTFKLGDFYVSQHKIVYVIFTNSLLFVHVSHNIVYLFHVSCIQNTLLDTRNRMVRYFVI
jgi:hypothetical protein